MDKHELAHRFEHHPPKDSITIDRHHKVRVAALALAVAIDELVPDGREKATALTKTEEAMMWANAGIARIQ